MPKAIKKKAGSNGKRNSSVPKPVEWYRLPVAEVLAKIGSTAEGLSDVDAESRLQTFGRNILPRDAAPSAFRIFLHQFKSPLIYILLAAAAVSMAIEDYTDTIFILAVVLINAAIGTLQEYKSEKSARALQSLMKTNATVRRRGGQKQIDAELLVPGDIVLLQSGDKVPADVRLLKARNLTVNESILTGESTASEKNAERIDEANLEPGDQADMIFAGTSVISGRAEGVVVETGANTELGQISGAVSRTESAKPPLVIRMDRFARELSVGMLGAILALGVISAARGTPLLEVFFMAVALAVSAIPEGLPVAMTVALSVGVNRMARRHVIVRKLTAVEGLGSCTYIASDKTGTLTSNEQTARMLVLSIKGNGFFRFPVTGHGGDGEIQGVSPEHWDHVQLLARTGIICSDGQIHLDGGKWRGEGDPIDVAFLALGHKAGLDPAKVRSAIQVSGDIPYESERKFSVVFFGDSDGTHRVAMKGAIEKVVAHCDRAIDGRPLQDRSETIRTAEELAEDGYRVIAVALGEAKAVYAGAAADPAEDDIPPLAFLGLVGFIDPLRPEAANAVRQCHEAGVKVGMITGDHPRTALAIARDLGIAENKEEIVTGSDFEDLERNPERMKERIASVTVFARISPIQKVRIVETLIDAGHFVAVTGDGVNDAPALHKANIGVAMGSGNDVAKDTGSIIITDDNFSSIAAGIEEGRRAYQNLRKVIYLLVSIGVAEVILFTLALLSGLPLPLVAVQLLWLNLVTNGIQHIGLAFEAGEKDTMQKPPRNPAERVFNPLLVQETIASSLTMAVVAFLFWWGWMKAGLSEAEARNFLLLQMVLFENFHALNCRSEMESALRIPLGRNPILVLGILAALGVHLGAMYLPILQPVLGVRPIGLRDFAMLFLSASSVLVVIEIFKFAKRRRSGR